MTMLSETQLKQIAEQVGVGISVISMPDIAQPETWVIVFNNLAAAEASQASIHGLQGKRFIEAFPGIIDTPFIEWYQQVARTGQPMELPEIVYGDELIPESAFRVLLSPLSDKAVLGQYINITLQRQAEGELKKLNAQLEKLVEERTSQLKLSRRSVGEISQAAAHELRTPLRKLLLTSEFSQDEMGVEARECLRQLDDQLDALLRYTAFDPESRPEVFSPAEVLNQVLGRFKRELSVVELNQKIKLEKVTTNKVGFGVVLEQLISNSLLYRRETGAYVSIEIFAHDDDLKLVVRDNGIGIPDESLENVFRAFRRLHPHSKYPGAGVGLTMCRDIVEACNGEIAAQSNISEGSLFCATFPGAASVVEPPV